MSVMVTPAEAGPVPCITDAFPRDDLDFDRDGLSDRLEMEGLLTDPCDRDHDGDGIDDGYDAAPFIYKDKTPIKFSVAYIKQIHPDNNCDALTNWDPYFTVFGISLPMLGESSDIQFTKWTEADHKNGRSETTNNPTIEEEEGSGWIHGNALRFDITSDMRFWSSSGSLDLVAKPDIQLVDHDVFNDDYMDFDPGEVSVLGPRMQRQEWISGLAYDAKERNISCQAMLAIHIDLPDVSPQVLAVAYKKIESDDLVTCALVQICAGDDPWSWWTEPPLEHEALRDELGEQLPEVPSVDPEEALEYVGDLVGDPGLDDVWDDEIFWDIKEEGNRLRPLGQSLRDLQVNTEWLKDLIPSVEDPGEAISGLPDEKEMQQKVRPGMRERNMPGFYLMQQTDAPHFTQVEASP